uniref:Uncharacterized protein n=1 Tax=Myotis myotis TaxID=51298 RepID=A0A7J7SRM4_MYOMY|nr:hypothetical protein mMyoMyo1_009421 [Myotis myotis]
MHLPVPDHVQEGARGAFPGRGALRPHTRPRPSGPQLPTVARGRTDGPGAELGLAGRATSTGLPAEGALRDRQWRCLRNGGDRTRRPLHSRALLPPAPGFNSNGGRGDGAGPGRAPPGTSRRGGCVGAASARLTSGVPSRGRVAAPQTPRCCLPSRPDPHGACAAA